MYQLEVKRFLVEHKFRPNGGWEVVVDVDAMERAKGGKHPPDKRRRAAIAVEWLISAGVSIGKHPTFGRADIVASMPGGETFVIEVEGQSSRQPEQAMYSALGQIVLLMNGESNIRLRSLLQTNLVGSDS